MKTWPAYVLGILLTISIVLGPFNIYLYNKSFYFEEYNKYKVFDSMYEKYGIDRNGTVSITNNIIHYIKSGGNITQLDKNEMSHMKDVYSIMNFGRSIYYISTIILIAGFIFVIANRKKHPKQALEIVKNTLLIGGIFSIAMLGLVFLSSVLNFEKFFVAFHLIFFPQGNWYFNDGILITLFPQGFFYDMAVRIFMYGLFSAILILAVGIWLHINIKRSHRYFKH